MSYYPSGARAAPVLVYSAGRLVALYLPLGDGTWFAARGDRAWWGLTEDAAVRLAASAAVDLSSAEC